MRALALAVFFAVSPAHADEPGAMIFVTERAEAVRFPDADERGPTFGPGDRVEVLVTDGDRVRVLGPDGEIGWIEAASTGTIRDLPEDLRDRVISDMMESFRGTASPAGGFGR